MRTYKVTGAEPLLYVECSTGDLFGPYTLRTNANRRKRALEAEEAKNAPAPEPLPDPVAMAAPAPGMPGYFDSVLDTCKLNADAARCGIAEAAKNAADAFAAFAESVAPVVARRCVGVYPYARKRDYRMSPARTF